MRRLFWKVEMNPVWQQKKLRDFCTSKSIHIAAYSPLGAIGTTWGSGLVMECELLKEIAEARGKTVAQVLLILFALLKFIYVDNL